MAVRWHFLPAENETKKKTFQLRLPAERKRKIKKKPKRELVSNLKELMHAT